MPGALFSRRTTNPSSRASSTGPGRSTTWSSSSSWVKPTASLPGWTCTPNISRTSACSCACTCSRRPLSRAGSKVRKPNIDEALLRRADIATEKRDDWEEVQNYVAAMNKAIDRLKTLPFSSRLIREAHGVLMHGVRGQHKMLGEFRRSQNWIGGATINDAVFVPPVHTLIDDLMSDLEAFVHDEKHYFPELLKIALVHYQFETIHPFLDSNGRIGRLMITLYLVSKRILKRPVLYLSDFFERNRTLYYDNLMRVRQKNDLDQWFKFFLVGLIETAKSGIATFDNILKLQRKVESQLQTLGSRAAKAHKVLEALYRDPIADAARVAKIAKLSPASAYKLIGDLERI